MHEFIKLNQNINQNGQIKCTNPISHIKGFSSFLLTNSIIVDGKNGVGCLDFKIEVLNALVRFRL